MDLDEVRREFPALSRRLAGRRIVFADNASTTLKPWPVIEAVLRYYTDVSANVYRGVGALALEAERLYEGARRKVARFINAEPSEIVFVRGATEAVRAAAGLVPFRPLDEVVASVAEHQANLLPWEARAHVFLADVDGDGRVDPGSVERLITRRTRLVALGHVSNVTGLVNPVDDVLAVARDRRLFTLVDATQSVPHMRVDVKRLGCDFLVFSAHKMLGPSGVGVLYARKELLDEAASREPCAAGTGGRYRLDGEPSRLESGTPNIEGVIGLGAAVDFLQSIGMDAVRRHSLKIGRELVEGLRTVPGLKVYPECTRDHVGVASFVLPGMSADALARELSTRFAVMTRSGFHCAESLVRALGQPHMVRASLYLYNTREDVDAVVSALRQIRRTGAG